jgi:hypothetical protein
MPQGSRVTNFGLSCWLLQLHTCGLQGLHLKKSEVPMLYGNAQHVKAYDLLCPWAPRDLTCDLVDTLRFLLMLT